ncbi:MAG: VanZ family protein [Acidobacteria bacterium]|nr:VanZ family protein [Acidobacteriota bacterium]
MSELPLSKRLLYLALPLGWMACLFFFSTDVLSSNQTGSVIEPLIHKVVRTIDPTASPKAVWLGHLLLRKLGHLTEYACLAILWAVVLRKVSGWSHRSVLLMALIFSVGYAVIDEWHQTFTLERSGTIQDVIIDGMGALIGLGILSLIWWWKIRREQSVSFRRTI